MAVNEGDLAYDHPLYSRLERMTGVTVGLTSLDALMTWGSVNSLWVFPMATSCCAIEFITANASRVDVDQLGSIVRPSPRHSDVMVVAGTITVKMAPRVKKLWDQMPEPKWCIAMGSCAISGDFYRNIYSVVPGVDTIVPVDVYIPGCPPNPDQVFVGLQRLQDKVRAQREGRSVVADPRPETETMILPEIGRLQDAQRDAGTSQAQLDAARRLGLGGGTQRAHDTTTSRQGGVHDDRDQGER